MPYFHASVADFIDGSSFEVVIAHPRKIMIIPGPKASVAALSRFIEYIVSEFGEGEVGEHVHEQDDR